jgi:TP901 family phage tail tape measure protein
MNDNLSILIQAVLDGDGSKAGINAQLKTLAANVDKLKIKVTLSDEALQSIQNIVAGMKTIAPATQQANQALQQTTQALQQQGQAIQQQTQAVQQQSQSIQQQNKVFDQEIVKITKTTNAFLDHDNNIQRIIEGYNRLGEMIRKTESLDPFGNVTKTFTLLSEESLKYEQSLAKIVNFQQKMRDNMNNLLSTPQGQFVDSAQLDAITQQINSLSANSPFLTQQIQSIAQAYKQVSIEAKNAAIDQSAMIAQAKKEAQEQEKLAKALSQVDLYRRKMYGEIARLEIKPEYQFIDPAKLAAIIAQLDSLNAKSPLFREKIKEISQAYKELTASAKSSYVEQQRGVALTEQLNRQIGVFEQLKGANMTEANLTQVINGLYSDRTIRMIKLDEVTGRWSVRLSETAEKDRVLAGTIDQTTGALYRQSSALTDVTTKNQGFMYEFGVAIKRIPVWMLGMTMFYQSLRFFSNGIKYVNDLNKALTEISIVTGKSQVEVDQLGEEYANLAYQMRVTTKEVAEASVTFYRQGLSQAEVMERVRVATQYAKIANIEFATASEILTATVNSLGIDIEHAADVMAYLGDATATGADEIGVAMQKVGGSAAAAGLEYEKLSSWIALVSAKTRESAETIGVAFNTIIARYRQLTESGYNAEDDIDRNQVIKSLYEVGINALDASGRLRNLGDILDELGPIWNSLNEKQQSYVLTTMAGTRQQSRLANLLNDYRQSFELYEGALSAAGTTQQKYNQYLQSTEAYLNQLKTAGTGIWQQVFNSEDIRTGIVLMTSLVNTFGWLIDKLGFFPTIVGGATIALSLFNKQIKQMGILSSWSVAEALGLSNAMLGLGMSSKTAAVGVGIFNAALNVGAIMLITAAIQGLFNVISKAREENAALDLQEQQSIENYRNKKDNIEALLEKYNELNDATSDDIEKQKELQNIQNQLGRLLPGIIDYVDENGNAHLRSAEKIQEEIDKLRELQDEYDRAMEKRRQNEIKQIQSELRSLYSRQGYMKMPENQDILWSDEEFKSVENRIESLSARLQELYNSDFSYEPKNRDPDDIIIDDDEDDSTSEFLKSFDLSLTILEQVNAEVDTLKDTLKYITDEEEKRNFINEKLAPAYRKQLSVLTNVAGMQSDMLNDAKSSLKSLVSDEMYQKIISGDYSTIDIKSEKIADAIDRVRDLTSAFYDTQSSIRDVNGALVQLGIDADAILQQQYDDWVRQAENAAEQVINAYKEYYRQQKDIQDKAIQDQIDKEEQRHDRVIKQLDEELDSYEKIINAKLRLLDDAADEEDYAKKLNKAQQERAEIQKQIDILQMDDSIAARAKVSELRKQLSEKDESIYEMQTNRERDLRKKSLQDQLNDYKDKIKKQKDMENDRYNDEKKQLQEIRKQWRGYYDNLINNEREWSKIRKDILSGDQTKINSIMSDLQNKNSSFASGFTSSLTEIGNSIKANLIDNLTKAIGLIREIAGNPIPSLPSGGSGGKSSDGSSTDIIEVWGHTYEIKDNGHLIFKNGVFVPAENFKYLPNSVLERAREMKQNAASYDTGGMTPAWGNDPKLALLHEKELILNKNETSDFLKGLQILRNVIPQIVPTQTTTTNNNTPVTVNMHVSVKGGKNTGQDIVKQFITGLQRVGVPVT